ncbi:MAG: zinc ribbon domain-containing protein [Clostridia bacterium]|nr:zinc ribbon domain-containing protein [Clostridia bacterium]
MNKKFVTGLIVLLVGLALDGFGIYTVLQSVGTGLFYVNSWYGQLLNGWVYMLTGPAVLLIGIVLTLIGYFKACKHFVAPERKPKVKKEKAPKPARMALVAPAMPVANPVAPAAPVPTAQGEEKTVFAPRSPLDATQISYTFCGKCGRRNKTGAKFCAGCGEKL